MLDSRPILERGRDHNNRNKEPSERLISESKDILSDGSDSDVLVIDMGMNKKIFS